MKKQVCEICGSRYMLQRHHRFRNSKVNKQLYPEYLNHDDNIQIACANCHVGHRSEKLEHWTEQEFCSHFKIEMRSKTAKLNKLSAEIPLWGELI